MAEDYIPELTLYPNSPLGSAAQAAAPAPAQEQQTAPVQQDLPASDLDEAKLSEAERKAVEEFARTIDITDSNLVLQYGAAAQKNVSEFSESTLQQIRTKDLGEIGDTLAGLVKELQSFEAGEEKKGLAGFFRKKKNQLESMKAGYAKASANVDKIVESLEQHQLTLMKDVANLDQMVELNAKYQKELTMYILAGKKKLEKERSTTLVELSARAKQSNLPEDAQKARDFADMCTRFEKKIYDLELTRNISMQMAPQIRLIQNGDTLMAEKIQSTINNTIPLWKNQMVLALGLAHSKAAVEAQREVSDLTNELLKKNAEALKTGTVAIAEESERSIVDIETVRYTNEQLISTLDEVLRIADEGRAKRLAAENEMIMIENELKTKLLDIRK